MKRHHVESGIPTIEVALSEYMNSADLKQLAALTNEKLPTRKADLAAVIMRHLDGERLRTVWQGLDEPAARRRGRGRAFELDPVLRRPFPRQVRPRSQLGNDRQA